MIDLGSRKSEELERAFWQCSSGAVPRWLDPISLDGPAGDPFVVLRREQLAPALAGSAAQDMSNWLSVVFDWVDQIQNPSHVASAADRITYEAWETFYRDLVRCLREARLAGHLPKRGGVLCYVAGLSQCVVCWYQFEGDLPHIEVVSVIPNPSTAFDVIGAVEQASFAARSTLKSILAFGHKTIFHRNTLIYIDRRADWDVFGPSIDTLVLAEVLAQAWIENYRPCTRVLEIGCGNGLLSGSVMMNAPCLRHLVCLDNSFRAITCTYRNLSSLVKARLQRGEPEVVYICGDYAKSVVGTGFDLILCNPPYIPEPPGGLRSDRPDYRNAVAGVELGQMLLGDLPDLLAPSGALIMMTSSLSLDYMLKSVPDGYKAEEVLPSGFKVPFDVEAVLLQPHWLDELANAGGLMESNGIYYHQLHPLIVQREVRP